jgi:CubicO group peptidase (beta-lactamase class C family)
MRRVITLLTAVAVVCVSLGIGVITADVPFWRRALELPLAPDALLSPVAVLGAASEHPIDPALDTNGLTPAALERAAALARDAGAAALLVRHRGRLVFERYFDGADPSTMMPGHFLARTLAALATGVAVRTGLLGSLDTPVSRYLPEWNDARGAITLRQLLQESSGLETGGDAAELLGASPFDDPARLPRFATSKGVRMLLGNDLESTALGFALAHEPGAFFHPSPANAQILAIIIERQAGGGYERFVAEKLWGPIGAGVAEMQLDRRTGMPAAHCCLRATARDLMRLGALLLDQAPTPGAESVLPEGWALSMREGSRANPEVGMQLKRLARADGSGNDPLWIVSDGASALWIAPESDLAVLSVSRRPGTSAVAEIPAAVRGGLAH